MTQIEYSVVVPVYNSQDTLNELTNRITAVFHDLNYTYEILLVDDYSMDDSWKVMQSLHQKDKNIKIIHLIRNFGQHNATICGFNHSSGKYIITMDDDLQHPPEEIPKLIDKINEGFMVVYGKYLSKQHNPFENYFSDMFQKLMQYILKIPSSIYLSSFVIYTKETTQSMSNIKSSFPFLFALMIYSTHPSKIANVMINHQERKVGKSNYGVVRYFKYSMNLIINYSSLPLTLVGISGFLISIFSILFGILIIVQKTLNPNYGVMGWNSIMVAIALLGGSILMSVAIIGEYLRRILTEISYGQQYLVDKAEL